ncbi:hypothetical protein [Altibacter sp. HG106]|uniref:hypothetical protein n=1 Tax=Altibacter sp. HG106 TaxID=3023937 RepID=UPI00235000C9|nr:hypothetical protein [Altibacter sp. HG106]MDC7995534.1 hypothetical protein [Altibacter sp. HG106]
MKLKYIILICCIAVTCFSCESDKDIPFLYQHFAQPISCEGADKALMHEALYTFQHDIARRYKTTTEVDTTAGVYFLDGYRNYIFRGTKGGAKYQEIQRSHTQKIVEQLLEKYPDFWIEQERGVALNYNHPYVACILDKFTNPDVKLTIKNLREAHSYRPGMMAEVFRKNISDVASDPYFAMYIALDTYYRNLITIQQENAVNND